MMRALFGTAFLLLAWSLHGGAGAAPPRVKFESSVHQVALIELYTSEGCSSCPPADRWLAQLKSNPGLWKDFVPVAFHVDYWDYIGWEDRFAQPEFSQRQRGIAAQGGVPTVYTPGVLKDGNEWRRWHRGDSIDHNTVPVGVLSVESGSGQLSVRFDPRSAEYSDLDVYVAVLGMNLRSEVTAGENAGRTLYHDFVVLDLISRPLIETDDEFAATVPLSDPTTGTELLALAAWVSEQGSLLPVQAVGGYLQGI